MTESQSTDPVIRFSREGRTLFGVVLTATLMSEESPLVNDAVIDEIRRVDPEVCNVVIDLHEVRTMNSAALGMLFAVRMEVVRLGLEFCLLGVAPLIKQLLVSTRADKVFRIFDSDADLREAIEI